jgi:tetratricopeptide (TPR) repeat protein
MNVRILTRLAVAGAAVIGALSFLFPQVVARMAEDIALSHGPSAQQLFDYGERYFSSSSGNGYDIVRAYDLFKKAGALDPSLPYLFHELARIQFLRGEFPQALALINTQIAMHGKQTQNSYYVRGLIEGYMGDYEAAEADYAYFLQTDPSNWAAMNDYAWILLKAGKPEDALRVTARGTSLYPENPWLLNSLSIAQYELGSLDDALDTAQRAVAASQNITKEQWLTAYPGNDPKTAAEGAAALRQSAVANMHSIEIAIASSAVQ